LPELQTRDAQTPGDGESRSKWGRLARAWVGLDRRSLAAFRIGLAVMVLRQGIEALLFLRPFYTDDGILPRADAVLGLGELKWRASLFFLGGGTSLTAALIALQLVAALALLAGYRTRAATAVCWFLIMSIQVRNLVVINVGDRLLRMLLFWSLFLPLGAWCSVDRMRKVDHPPPQKIASVATFALLFQFFLMTTFSGLFKSHSEVWMRGEGIYYAISTIGIGRSTGRAMLSHPDLLRLATWSVAGWEALGAFLLFSPWKTELFRWVVVVGYTALFLGLDLFLYVGPIPYLALVALLAFLPGSFWDRVVPRAQSWAVFSRISSAVEKAAGGLRMRTLDARPASATTFGQTTVSKIAVALLLAYVLLWNVSTVNSGFEMPGLLVPIGKLLDIDQSWGMFTRVSPDSGWLVAAGKLADGSDVDLLGQPGEPLWDPPKSLPNHRWQSLVFSLQGPRRDFLVPRLAAYACRRWNRDNAGPLAATRTEIVFMRKTTPPFESGTTTPAPPGNVERVPLGTFECSFSSGSSRKETLGRHEDRGRKAESPSLIFDVQRPLGDEVEEQRVAVEDRIERGALVVRDVPQ
jgi:hypothetical protein